jgi:hypothetical protein
MTMTSINNAVNKIRFFLCYFFNVRLYQNYEKKYVFPFEKKYFDSLALKPLWLYVNSIGHLVAYSQPFHLLYR